MGDALDVDGVGEKIVGDGSQACGEVVGEVKQDRAGGFEAERGQFVYQGDDLVGNVVERHIFVLVTWLVEIAQIVLL